MRYMIHACPQRMWYVEDYLVPYLMEQDIFDIEIWNDTEEKGNLFSCMDSFMECGLHDGGTWHLQDDIVICSDFADRTKNAEGIVCGFCCDQFENDVKTVGKVAVDKMWYSFQCIHIPNEIAGECAEWFYCEAVKRSAYDCRIAMKKFDDWFFMRFLEERHKDIMVTNLVPGLVDHIDYLIGGTVTNTQRIQEQSRAVYFEDKETVKGIEKVLWR